MPNPIVGLGVAMCCANANAVTYCMSEACGSDALLWGPSGSNCKTSTTVCYNDVKVKNCLTCNSGYSITQKSGSVDGCSNTIMYDSCEQSATCNNCDNKCISSSWTASGTGYEQRTISNCNISTCLCVDKAEYRCAAGYYGSPTTNMSGCTRCPAYSGVYGTNSAGSTSVSSCCISSGSTYTFSDSIGSGNAKITSTCCAS